jgi:hypothetical protein
MFNKYGKKIMSLAMASAMIASMAVPAFAEDKTEVTVTYKDVPIAVTVPSDTTSAWINPYGLPMSVTTTGSKTESKITGQQIVTTPMAITNDGDVALSVGAKVVTTPTGLTIVSKAPTAKTTDKQAFVQLQMVASTATGDKTNKANAIEDTIFSESATASTWANATSLTLVAKTTENPDAAATADNMATLAASKVTKGTGGTADTIEYQAGSVVLVRLTGTVTQDPTTAWTTSDTFTSVITYTFKPASTNATA